MLPSVWSHLCRRRSLLPARDIFDADLDRARRKPGCALCRLVREHDQQGMHSFLWEYCTDPQVGVQISPGSQHWHISWIAEPIAFPNTGIAHTKFNWKVLLRAMPYCQFAGEGVDSAEVEICFSLSLMRLDEPLP